MRPVILIAVVVAIAGGGVLAWLLAPLPAPEVLDLQVDERRVFDEDVTAIEMTVADLTPVCCLQCYLDVEVRAELVDADGSTLPVIYRTPCPESRDLCIAEALAGCARCEPAIVRDLSTPGEESETLPLSLLVWPGGERRARTLRLTILDRKAARTTTSELSLR